MGAVAVWCLVAWLQPGVLSAQQESAASSVSALHQMRGQQGMVVSASRPASEVGRKVIEDGGNAVDAAIATGFALAGTSPSNGNIGGGGFMVIRFPNGSTTAIDFR